MAISFNTGTAANSGGSATASQTLTIPAGVLAGDVLLLIVNGANAGTNGLVLQVASTGTSLTQIGTQQQTALNGGFYIYGAIYYCVASGSDAGKVITASFTSAAASFWSLGVTAYTGASSSSPIDVSGGAASIASPLAFPAETTTVSGDWAVYLSAFAESTAAAFTGPAGTTQRETTEANGVAAGIWDSNGSIGGSGTGIGGPGKTISSTAATVWFTAFTVGLAPPPAATVIAPVQGGGKSMLGRSMRWADL